MIASIRTFLDNGDGAVSIEYVILATMIAVLSIAGLTAIGGQLSGQFSEISVMYK